MKLNKEAINEITYLLNEVKDVVRLLEEFGLNITSDPWQATSFCDKENILTWSKKDFEKINTIKCKDKFYVGGNIITGSQHKYKNKSTLAPKELAEIQGNIFKKYLQNIIKKMNLKHFKLNLSEPYGLIDNCGWEHFICIEATVKESGLKRNALSLAEEIMEIEDIRIELSGSPLYQNPKNYFNKESQLVPEGDFEFMVEFLSDLILDEDYIYQGTYGLNSKYIKDAMRLITDVESKANEIENKYADKGVKVTVNGLNDGCEKGMAVYVWIPYQ